MLARGGVLGLVFLVLWVWALVDVVRTPADRHRRLPKPVWIVVVALFFALGALAWIAFGRPRDPSRRLSEARDDASHLSDRERRELERREYYKRMDDELDRRLEERRRGERGDEEGDDES